MAVTCARCGAVNPDGNQFCQTCGTPLAAAAPPATPPVPGTAPPPGPPVAYASPPPIPVGYQSPYFTPNATAPQPPVHRTPWVLIVSGVVVLVVLMAGCGTALALFGKGNISVSGGINSSVPSPSPAGSPSPIASPTSVAGASTASNAGETIPVPQGWSVVNKDSESISLINPNGDGSVSVASGPSNPKQSAQQNKATADKIFQGKFPDTKDCPGSQTTTSSLDGAPGIFWTLCFTYTSGAQSFPAAVALFAGANADGSVYYVVSLLTNRDNLSAFATQATPILQGIQWKLK